MKKMIVALLVLAAMLSAAFVSQDAAQNAAENYYKNYAPISDKGNMVQSVIAHEYEGQITWYGVNFDNGFVIINAEDALKPILGYSFTGQLADPTEKDGGLAFKEWFGFYDKQVNVARKYAYVDAAAQTEWKNVSNNIFPKASKGIVVDALVRSHWDQGYPWNDLCPDKSIGTTTYTGCVATAAVMLMKYHEWPPTGTGSNSYSWDGQTLSETFSNYNFDYTVMEHDVEIEFGLYPTYWETVNMDAAALQNMAELNYVVGQSFDMSYGDDADGGSGAFMADASAAMNSNWYYTSSLTNVGTPTDPAYDAANIQAELDAKRPWWWAGGVHSFILDGYTDDAEPWYHFNWGWGGSSDGWFQISSLIPSDLGAGAGDEGDYTGGQIRISLVPDTYTFNAWPAPTGFSGSLVSNENVSLTWNAASGALSYDVFKNVGMGAFELLTNTTSTSYSDNGLGEGLYSYFVRAIYSGGESHNTDSYSIDVVSLPGFSSVRSFGAEGVGRTNIDLTWDVPFTGVIFFDENFEAGMTGWTQKQSAAAGVKPPSRDYFLESVGGWGILDFDTFSDMEYIHSGDFATGLSYTAGDPLGDSNGTWSWNFTPEFTIPAGGGFISFWIWYKNNATEGWYTNIRAYMYQGDFTEQSVAEAEGNLTNIFTWLGSELGEAGNNLYDSEVYIDLAAFAGTYRFGWAYEYTDGYQLAVDDLLCGTTVGGTDLPDEYDIYRNGSFAATVPYTADSELWSDTNFADGINSYFVKAIYPTGSSLVSGIKSVTIDANPNPDYLTGVLNGTDIELAWYMPYGTPSHWAAYITPENCTTTIDVLADTDCAKRRVQFTAADLGLYYPVTIDSIAAGFYEWDDDLWGANDTFTMRLWDGDPTDGTLLWESAILTATAGEVYKVALPTPQVMTSLWNVEVEVYDLTTGHPAN
nr:C10 family peptidase [Candidatus Delongbacteria bacterium]